MVDDFMYNVIQMGAMNRLDEGKLPVVVIQELKKVYKTYNFPALVYQQAVAEIFEWEREVIWCEARGHKFEDDSYGNPESGYMGATCKRCGYSFGQILY